MMAHQNSFLGEVMEMLDAEGFESELDAIGPLASTEAIRNLIVRAPKDAKPLSDFALGAIAAREILFSETADNPEFSSAAHNDATQINNHDFQSGFRIAADVFRPVGSGHD